MGNTTPDLGREGRERDEPSPFPPGEIRSIQRFCPWPYLEFRSVQGWLVGRKGKQNIPCGCCRPRTPRTLRSSSLGLRPPGINKPGANSHPGVSWINKCLGERPALWGTCWESPAGLGIGELNTPAWPGRARALISPWGWMFAWPEGRAL